jgi:hypothetical protein
MVNDGETGGQRKKSSKEQDGRHIWPPSSLTFTGHPPRIKLLTTKQRTEINYANQQKPMNIKLKGGCKDSREKKSIQHHVHKPTTLSFGDCREVRACELGRQRDWHLFDYWSIILFVSTASMLCAPVCGRVKFTR